MIPNLSVVIPAYNEEDVIKNTLENLCKVLERENINYEILVINDHSFDQTGKIVNKIIKTNSKVFYYDNISSNGFGYAVRTGLNKSRGKWVAIMMADQSDDPEDLVRFYNEGESYDRDAVFGNRFINGSKVRNYPKFKLILNRLTNWIICLLFTISYSDVTNAFKLYKKTTLKGLEPLISPHFNLTVELPLKVIVRGYDYSVIYNNWYNRSHGVSKLKIKEMGSRYWFIIFYCLIEKWLSLGDYRKQF